MVDGGEDSAVSDFLIFEPDDEESGVGSFFVGAPSWFDLLGEGDDFDSDEPPQDTIHVV